jgi:hypothetical protein
VNSLPEDYSGKLTIVLNDFSYLVTLRNILILQILGTVSDVRLAADIALHLWYSAFIPQDYFFLVNSLAMKLVEQGDIFESKLSDRTSMLVDINSDLREVFESHIFPDQTLSKDDAANEIAKYRYVKTVQ